MKNDEQLQEDITRLLLEYDAGYTPPEIPKWLALIHEERRAAVDEFQDRLDEKEFTLGGDTTTPAIVYQWMQEVSDEMFPSRG
jgi:hypothetical protein